MSDFVREQPNIRLVQTHWGDDLQSVSARELGDANRWPELVWLNNLRPPYVTQVADDAMEGVLLAGSNIKVPAPAGTWVADQDRGHAFERDCALPAGRLQAAPNGDLLLIAGSDNLTQQLRHRVDTPRGQLRRHPEYGCLLWRLLGRVNGPTAGALGTEYVRAVLSAEYRINRVLEASARVTGDAVFITARAEAIDGQIIDLVSQSPIGGGNGSQPGGPGAGWGNNYGNTYGT